VQPPRPGKRTHGTCGDYYRLLLASQLPEIIRTDCTRSAGAFALDIELLLIPEPDVPEVLPVPLVLPVPDPLVLPLPVVPAVLPLPVVPAVLPLPVLPVPAVPDVEPVADVPEVEPEP
jgi:hypothetical protein